MDTIGLFSGTIEADIAEHLTTLSIGVPIEIRLNPLKVGYVQPDYRVWSDAIECGAGSLHRSQSSGSLYVSLGLEVPEFGPRRIYAKLGRAAGQDNPDVHALIWNPAD